MRILIIDNSVLAYKCHSRIFSQDYEGETNDELHEFTGQYIHELIYLVELHQPDGILWVVDCPREDVWRHKVVRSFYGPRVNAWAKEWYPGTEDKTSANACRYMVECHNSYTEAWIDADGSFKGKNLTKKKMQEWAAEKEITLDTPDLKDRSVISKLLPVVAPMYKGNREGRHWPKSSVLSKEQFGEVSKELLMKVAPLFKGKVAQADALEADDVAYAAVCKWRHHDITIVTTDMDWIQMAAVKGTDKGKGEFKFWNPNKYEFEDVSEDRVKRIMYRKLMEGDSSDNIKSAKMKGKVAGIGKKKADTILDEVPIPELKAWLEENGDPATFKRNEDLILLHKMPEELKERAENALANSRVANVEQVALEELASEATIHMARVAGQKERQKIRMQENT